MTAGFPATTNAWPVLKKFDYPFTLFIYINYVGTGGKSLSWDQLKEMRDAGVDIQSHTYSHGDLRSPTRKGSVDKRTMGMIENDIKTLGMDGWMDKEIAGSKKVLEEQLGIRVNALAYPFGNYSQKARDVVKKAGYEAAFTVYGQQLRFSSPAYRPTRPLRDRCGQTADFYGRHAHGGGWGGWPASTAAGRGATGRFLDGHPADGRRDDQRSESDNQSEPGDARERRGEQRGDASQRPRSRAGDV